MSHRAGRRIGRERHARNNGNGGELAESAGAEVVHSHRRGVDVLTDPRLNKGSAFTPAERRALGLEGLLPHQVCTIEQQVHRAYQNIVRKSEPLEQYIGLVSLQDRNETLFYRLLVDHVEHFLPIAYTPTVGLACQRFSHIYRRQRGLWITPEHRGRIAEVLANTPSSDVRLIVVTDNERILGLGDQGAGGIGISIGKTVLYTVAAGIHPSHTLPISLDVGTDNQQLLDDELYLGWRYPRLRGPDYDSLVEEFVVAVKHLFPRALLQWEDFKQKNAYGLLERYRKRLLTFNDDIQGTSAIGGAALLAAARATGTPLSRQRVVICGAGSAGVGIAGQLKCILSRAGLSADAVRRAVLVLDKDGFLHDRREISEPSARQFAWPAELATAQGLPMDRPDDLEAVVGAIKPTMLIGVSGQGGIFTRPIIRAMATHVDRPMILPLSNPTSKAEATPADLIEWTGGRALVATGSPFEPVTWEGRTIRIGQGNNVFVFPGIGLGALVAEASRISDAMFTIAADTLSSAVTDEDLAAGSLFPRLSELRRITARLAEAVIRQAREEGVGRSIRDEDIPAAVAAAMWYPDYAQTIPSDEE
jgi:malic enzyme